ncbi:MAG: hypothetical protein Q8N44_00460 [Rubrivivax sp.]|nr:hypothetical protein [Rubrivivax sp.]
MTRTMKSTSLIGLLLTTGAAHAHDGHGLAAASHWHATDLFGFLAVLAVVGVALWWTRRR